MKRNMISLLLVVPIVCMTSAASFALGKQKVEKQFLSSAQEESVKKESTQIAIVNQDQGVKYNSQDVNYAMDLVNSLSSDFVLTNRDAAKKGLENGKYGGMIILPGNFSKKVTSINDVTPSKVEVYYEANEEITKESQLIVLGKIADFEKKLNNKLSYMYICSVFDELHKGQDSVSEILKNDDIDMEALEAVSSIDILEVIEFTDMEDEEINFEELDLSGNFEEGRKVIEQIDEKYRERLLSRDEDLQGIKDELSSLLGSSDEGIQSFRSKIEAMTPEELEEALSKRRKYNYGDLTSYYDVNKYEIDKYLDELTKDTGMIDNLVSTYNSEVLAEAEKKGTEFFSDIDENLNALREKSEAGSNIIENDVMRTLKNLDSSLRDNLKNDTRNKSLNEENLFYSQIVLELIKYNPGEFEKYYKNVVDRTNVEFTDILKDPTAGASPSNSFNGAYEFKSYIIGNAENRGQFSMARSSKYKGIDTNDITANENSKIINSAVNNLKNIKNDLNDVARDAEHILGSAEYRYLNKLFACTEEEPLIKKLKLNEGLIKEIKENIRGNNQQSLMKNIQLNNEKNVQDLEGRIALTVEKTLKDNGPVDVNALLEMFDENYMGRFQGLLNKTSGFTEAPVDLQEDNEIKSIMLQYDASNKEIEKAVNIKLEDYNKLIEKMNGNVITYIDGMKQQVSDGFKTSQELIEESLEEAKATKISTADNNKARLRTLSNVLSNSRVGTVENSEVYNFMINPVSAMRTEDLK